MSKERIRRDGQQTFGLLPKNLRTLRSLKTPVQIQKFLDALPYQYANTAWSPQRALRERKGHCLEGALLAAAALRINGHPPLLMDLEAVHDDDHVSPSIASAACGEALPSPTSQASASARPSTARCASWRSATLSTTTTCAANAPCVPTREPVNLERLDSQHWMTSEKNVWCVPELLIAARHYRSSPTRWRAHCPGSTAAASKQVCTAGRSTEEIHTAPAITPPSFASQSLVPTPALPPLQTAPIASDFRVGGHTTGTRL